MDINSSFSFFNLSKSQSRILLSKLNINLNRNNSEILETLSRLCGLISSYDLEFSFSIFRLSLTLHFSDYIRIAIAWSRVLVLVFVVVVRQYSNDIEFNNLLLLNVLDENYSRNKCFAHIHHIAYVFKVIFVCRNSIKHDVSNVH